MPTTPLVVVFDVNETLSDLSPLANTFLAVGSTRALAATWFASVLRDGFALTVSGGPAVFLEIARESARVVLSGQQLRIPVDEGVEAVMQALTRVRLHPDVAGGIRRLQVDGHRLFTLSNGSSAIAEKLFRESSIADCFERLLSVESHSAWKPARGAYERAAKVRGVTLEEMILVAVHPWDIDGAARAGMHTAWVNRAHSEYPRYFESPSMVVSSIAELAVRLDAAR